jgi:hypothetical protein
MRGQTSASMGPAGNNHGRHLGRCGGCSAFGLIQKPRLLSKGRKGEEDASLAKVGWVLGDWFKVEAENAERPVTKKCKAVVVCMLSQVSSRG